MEIQTCVDMQIGITSPQSSDTFLSVKTTHIGPTSFRGTEISSLTMLQLIIIKKCIQRINYVHLNALQMHTQQHFVDHRNTDAGTDR